MIKKTLHFGNPAHLSLRDNQLVIRRQEVVTAADGTTSTPFTDETTRPIEDLGIIVLEHRQITITSAAIAALQANNCAIISCNERMMPIGLMLPLESNTLQSERFQDQINASLPLRKQLWQQTIQQKIRNQSAVLHYNSRAETRCMDEWADSVRSGDPDNLEARAAHYYWPRLFSIIPDFARDRDGIAPNAMLNYGYAILRAIIARSLVGSGLLPTLGIHHHNRYNAYCLADDIMEPYRPYVDKMVFDLVYIHGASNTLTREVKNRLLTIPTIDVTIDEHRSPLMVAATQTTASLARCYAGEQRKIIYPEITK